MGKGNEISQETARTDLIKPAATYIHFFSHSYYYFKESTKALSSSVAGLDSRESILDFVLSRNPKKIGSE